MDVFRLLHYLLTDITTNLLNFHYLQLRTGSGVKSHTAFLHTISEEGGGDDNGIGSSTNGLHMRRHSILQNNIASSSSTGSNNNNHTTTQSISFEDSLNPNMKKKRHSGLFGLDCPSSPSKNQEYFRGNKFSLRNYLLRESLGIGEPGHLEPTAVGTCSSITTIRM